MGRLREGVDRAVTRRELAGGDWVDVRNQLTAGERDDAYAVSYETVFSIDDGERVVFNPRAFAFGQVAVHLVAWSLMRDVDGRPAPIPWPASVRGRVATLRALEPGDWDEVRLVVDAHTTDMDAARVAKKKAVDTDPGAPSSSPSAG